MDQIKWESARMGEGGRMHLPEQMSSADCVVPRIQETNTAIYTEPCCRFNVQHFRFACPSTYTLMDTPNFNSKRHSVTIQECFTVSDLELVPLSLSSTVTCAQHSHTCVFTNSLSTNTESVTVIPVCFYKRNPFTHPAAVYAGLWVFNNTVSKTE